MTANNAALASGPAGRANNFDALRFFAALAVLWSHCFPLTTGHEGHEPLMIISGGQTTLGSLAVAVFFFISGYLITISFERSATAWRYIKARVLRIVPALAVVLLLGALVLGPAVTGAPVLRYLADLEVYKYVAVNLSFLAFTDYLPALFVDNPVHHVNGPLWTLRFEMEAYFVILVLGMAGLLNRWVALALFVAGLAYLGLQDANEMAAFDQQNHRVKLLTYFMAGAVIHLWRVPLVWWLAAPALAVLLLTLKTGGLWFAMATLGAYLTLYLAVGTRWRLPDLARHGDLSYGIYIYAWPVQQVAVMMQGDPHWVATGLIAMPIVLALAFLSWHLVERPALRLKDRPFAVEVWLKQRDFGRLNRWKPVI